MNIPSPLDGRVLHDLLGAPRPPRVIDVRTPAEFETAHLPGAYNVPLDTLREHRDELAHPLGTDIVLVCRSGTRARQAESVLASAGLPRVHVLDGGMLAWEAAGLPVLRGRQRWDLERQVRLVAGSIVLLAVLGSLVVPGLQWLAAAVGAGLAVAALTNSCLMGALLSRLPYNRGPGCDLATLTTQLTGDPRTAR